MIREARRSSSPTSCTEELRSEIKRTAQFRAIFVCGLLLWLITPNLGVGQQIERDSLSAGTVVRMTFSEGEPEQGKLTESLHSYSEYVRYCPWPRPCYLRGTDRSTERLLAGVNSFEIKLRTQGKLGAKIGGAIGAILGAVTVSFANSFGDTSGLPLSTLESAGVFSAFVLGLGSVGYFVGAQFSTWQQIELSGAR